MVNPLSEGSGRSKPEEVELWLPSDLNNRIEKITRKVLMSPLVFLRKAVELHEVHRNPNKWPKPYYPDQENLTRAYGRLQTDEYLKLMHDLELEIYLGKLDEASEQQMTGQDPRQGDFTVVQLKLASRPLEYIDSLVSPIESPGLYLSAKAVGIAVAHELATLYYISDLPEPESNQ